MTTQFAAAVRRVRAAGVKAPASAVAAFVRCGGPASILRASLREIRAVAGAL